MDFTPVTPKPTMGAARLDPLDWLRGGALILILLSHSWAIWDIDRFDGFPPLSNALRSGNVGVTVFLVVAGFLLTRSLIGRAGVQHDEEGRPGQIGAAQPLRAIVSRVARLSSQVYPLLIVVLVLSAMDPEETMSREHTQSSVVAVATYTWNWHLQSSALIARPDFGHLWYTSVYLQVTVFLVILIWLLRRRRLVLVSVLVGLIIACTLWRHHLSVTEDGLVPLVRTTTRMDGMLWGALLALAWPWLHQLRRHGATLSGWALLSMLGLVLTVGNSSSYLGWAGIAANLAVVLFILGSPSVRPGALRRLLTLGPLVWLGRHSLSLYVWHYPVFFFTSRHIGDAPGLVKGLVAGVLTVSLATLTTRYVEQPVAARIATAFSKSNGTSAGNMADVSALPEPADPDSPVNSSRGGRDG